MQHFIESYNSSMLQTIVTYCTYIYTYVLIYTAPVRSAIVKLLKIELGHDELVMREGWYISMCISQPNSGRRNSKQAAKTTCSTGRLMSVVYNYTLSLNR